MVSDAFTSISMHPGLRNPHHGTETNRIEPVTCLISPRSGVPLIFSRVNTLPVVADVPLFKMMGNSRSYSLPVRTPLFCFVLFPSLPPPLFPPDPSFFSQTPLSDLIFWNSSAIIRPWYCFQLPRASEKSEDWLLDVCMLE